MIVTIGRFNCFTDTRRRAFFHLAAITGFEPVIPPRFRLASSATGRAMKRNEVPSAPNDVNDMLRRGDLSAQHFGIEKRRTTEIAPWFSLCYLTSLPGVIRRTPSFAAAGCPPYSKGPLPSKAYGWNYRRSWSVPRKRAALPRRI